MKLKNTMFISLAIRVFLFLFCFGFIGFRYLVSNIWFNPTETASTVRRALENDSSGVNDYNSNGFTGLMLAASRADYGIANALLAAGANPNLKSKNVDPETQRIEGNTALHLAAYNGDITGVDGKSGSFGIIWELVKHAADVNERNTNGDAPIHFLQMIDDEQNRLRVVQLFVQFGGDVNAQNNEGNTFLHLAIEAKDQSWVTIMLKYFGSIIDFQLKNNKGYTIRAWTKFLFFTDISAVFNKYLNENSEFRHIIGAGNNVDQRDLNGMTALMLAVIRNDKPFAERLINLRANINAKANNQWANSALHMSLLHNRVDMLQFLLQNGAQPNIINAEGLTPIFYVLALRGRYDIGSEVGEAESTTSRVFDALNALVKAGANINAQDSQGYTLLHRAIYWGATDLAVYMIHIYGDKINFDLRTRGAGRTVYALAKENNNQEVLDALDEFEATKNKR